MYIVITSNTFSSVFHVSSSQAGVQSLDAVTDYHNLVLQCCCCWRWAKNCREGQLDALKLVTMFVGRVTRRETQFIATATGTT